MQTQRRILGVPAALILGMASGAWADWNPGDPYKMHYPQLPDMQGIDVNASFPKVLADDWYCTESGPVADIHIWGSWRHDNKYPESWIHVSIHENVPADPMTPFSRPGALLWARDFAPGMYQQRIYGTGPQTFWDPKEPYNPTIDHFLVWQYNITEIPQPFIQQVGTIYWLDISFFAGYDPLGAPIMLPAPYQFGWKNSISPQFEDDAVWLHVFEGPEWHPLEDPRVTFPRSMDLAFVITPEPATMALIGLGLIVALRRRQ